MIEDVKAIDVHGHIGTYGYPGHWELPSGRMSASPERFLELARMSNIETSIVAHFPSMFTDPIKGNEETARLVEKWDELYQWVIINPLKPETFNQAAELIRQPKSAGLKVHSEIQDFSWKEHGEKIFEFAAKHYAVLAVNSGWKDDVPEDYSKLANRYPEVTLILTYLGRSHNTQVYKNDFQILAIRSSKVVHQNIYTDMASIVSLAGTVLEYVVNEIGAETVLFGTDSPNYFAPSKRIRVDKAALTDRQKNMILRDNAMRLFGRKFPPTPKEYPHPRIQGKIRPADPRPIERKSIEDENS